MQELHVAIGLRSLAGLAEQEPQLVAILSLIILVRLALVLQAWRQPSCIGAALSLLQELDTAIGTSSMHLSAALGRLECMKLSMKDLPQEVIGEHGLSSKAGANGWCCCEAREAAYGLKQAGYLAFKQLEKSLNAEGYYQPKLTPGLWLRKTRNISFTLAAGGFGACCKSKADAERLASALEERYPTKAGWKGGKRTGTGLGWGYGSKALATSMKGYAKKALL